MYFISNIFIITHIFIFMPHKSSLINFNLFFRLESNMSQKKQLYINNHIRIKKNKQKKINLQYFRNFPSLLSTVTRIVIENQIMR